MRLVQLSCLWLIVLTSCTNSQFDRYPGKKQNSFPKDWLGMYRVDSLQQTYKLEERCLIAVRDKKNDTTWLSDSFVFSKYNGYGFLSFYETHDNSIGSWSVIPLYKRKDTLIISDLSHEEAERQFAASFDTAASFYVNAWGESPSHPTKVWIYKMDEKMYCNIVKIQNSRNLIKAVRLK